MKQCMHCKSTHINIVVPCRLPVKKYYICDKCGSDHIIDDSIFNTAGLGVPYKPEELK